MAAHHDRATVSIVYLPPFRNVITHVPLSLAGVLTVVTYLPRGRSWPANTTAGMTRTHASAGESCGHESFHVSSSFACGGREPTDTTTETSLGEHPKVVMLDDEPVPVEAQERDAREILGASVDQPSSALSRGLRPDRHRRWAFRRHRRQPPLLQRRGRDTPVQGRGTDAAARTRRRRTAQQWPPRIVLRPSALPDVCPSLRGLPAVHACSLAAIDFVIARCLQ